MAAAERGMLEELYIEHYPYRLLRIHASASMKKTFLPFAVIAEGLGGGAGDGDGGGPDRSNVPNTPGNTQKVKSGNLPAWFRRKPGRHYNIIHTEGPINRLRGAAQAWGGGKTAGKVVNPQTGATAFTHT